MSAVQIWVQTPEQRGFLCNINETLIKRYSKTVRESLDGSNVTTLPCEVTLSGAAPAAISFVISKLQLSRHQRQLYIKVHDLPLAQAVAVFEAVTLLQIQPAQPHIENHILGFVSHHVPSPAEMVAIHKVFSDGASSHEESNSRVWKALVHHIAWNSVHGVINVEKGQELEIASLPFPNLHAAVEARLAVLRQKAEEHERIVQRAREREQRKSHLRLTKSRANRKQARKEQLEYEKVNGLRELSEDEARKLMGKH